MSSTNRSSGRSSPAMSLVTTISISSTPTRRGPNRRDSTVHTVFRPSSRKPIRGHRQIRRAYPRIIFIVSRRGMDIVRRIRRRRLADHLELEFFLSELCVLHVKQGLALFLVEPVQQACAVLPAHPKSPSRLKVCRFTDRYILCGRYGSGSLLGLMASGSL